MPESWFGKGVVTFSLVGFTSVSMIGETGEFTKPVADEVIIPLEQIRAPVLHSEERPGAGPKRPISEHTIVSSTGSATAGSGLTYVSGLPVVDLDVIKAEVFGQKKA